MCSHRHEPLTARDIEARGGRKADPARCRSGSPTPLKSAASTVKRDCIAWDVDLHQVLARISRRHIWMHIEKLQEFVGELGFTWDQGLTLDV